MISYEQFVMKLSHCIYTPGRGETQPRLAAVRGLGETSAGSQACQRGREAAVRASTILLGAKFSVSAGEMSYEGEVNVTDD